MWVVHNNNCQYIRFLLVTGGSVRSVHISHCLSEYLIEWLQQELDNSVGSIHTGGLTSECTSVRRGVG